jgi:ubiquinone/menaquinone biosynthesis C-methylase UbiE
MEKHEDRIKLMMSAERKKMHDPQTVLRNAGVRKGLTIADLGCGPGFFTKPLAQATGEKGLVYAVDSSETMLGSLKENIVKSAVNTSKIKIVNDDVCHTRIPNASVEPTGHS